jgi:hypothetical protein
LYDVQYLYTVQNIQEKPMTPRLTGATLVVAAVGTNAVFLALGSVFDYPDVLRRDPAVILDQFRAHETAVTVLFAALAVLSALLIPIAVALRSLDPAAQRHAAPVRIAAVVGILAGIVQSLGLLRWVFAVPSLAAAAIDPATAPAAMVVFTTLHQYLGVGIGETLGYLTTALWTVLVAAGTLRRLGQPVWLRATGMLAAVGIAVGIAEPYGLALAGTVNFIGYVVWSLWLLVTGILLLRRPTGS